MLQIRVCIAVNAWRKYQRQYPANITYSMIKQNLRPFQPLTCVCVCVCVCGDSCMALLATAVLPRQWVNYTCM